MDFRVNDELFLNSTDEVANTFTVFLKNHLFNSLVIAVHMTIAD